MMRTLLLLALTFLFSACTPNGSSSSQSPDKKIFEGDIYAEAQRIYGNQYDLYPCDITQKEIVLEVSRAVEENRPQILKLIEKTKADLRAENQDVKFFTLGGFQFYSRPQQNQVKDEWRKINFGWSNAYNLFQKIRNDLQNPDWIDLNAMARSLIVEDEDRILLINHPGLRRQEGQRVQRVLSVLDNCNQDANCLLLNFEPEDLSWLTEGVWYAEYYSRLKNDKLPFKKRRDSLKWLRDSVAHLAERYQFRHNPVLTFNGKELVVPVNLQPFGSDTEKVIKIIEESWSRYDLKIKLLASDKPEALQISVKNTPGERAYVLFKENKMVLFEPVAVTTLVHEFGHALGLRDTYYNSFDQNSCSYLDESNPNDIMSVSRMGQILPSHIEQIKKAYGIKESPSTVSPSKSVDIDVVKLPTY